MQSLSISQSILFRHVYVYITSRMYMYILLHDIQLLSHFSYLSECLFILSVTWKIWGKGNAFISSSLITLWLKFVILISLQPGLGGPMCAWLDSNLMIKNEIKRLLTMGLLWQMTKRRWTELNPLLHSRLEPRESVSRLHYHLGVAEERGRRVTYHKPVMSRRILKHDIC